MTKEKACDSCHRKKIFCDRGEPKCEWCAHRGLHCTYERATFVRTRKPIGSSLADEMEQRLERLERLVGPRIRQTKEMQTPEGTRRGPSTRDGGSYGMLNIPGYDLGIVSSHGGIPVFSSLALKWIQERTGDRDAFKAAYSTHAPDSSAPPVHCRPGPELPSRTAVESCLALFSSSPLRLVWPVVDVDSFQQTIQLAYTSPETLLLEVRIAKLCVLAFVAFLSVLEPVHTSVVSLDPKACAKQARDSLLSVLDQPRVEGLQAAITLSIYYDFSGELQLASMLHALACRCLYSLGGHLKQDSGQPRNGITKDTNGSAKGRGDFLRELFWLCYFFDKHISLRTGQPPCIDDDQCDLTLPGAHTGLNCVELCPDTIPMDKISLDTEMLPVLPGDLALTIIKSKVHTKLYSPHSLSKDDTHLFRTIRELDEELENWRMAVPASVRPQLSVTHEAPAIVTQHPLGMKLISAHFEYLYIIAAIHRACGRCHALRGGGEVEARVVSSSLAVSIQASRSTLIYLGRASKVVHSESFWLIIFYPTWATLNIFFNILLNPTGEEAANDIGLLEFTPALFKTMRRRQLTVKEQFHLKAFSSFTEELVRLAKRAMRRELEDS